MSEIPDTSDTPDSPDAPETPDSRLAKICVVLYEPQDPVNIAATVRAMKNMGVSTLRLVRPVKYDPVRLEGIAHDTWDIINSIEHYPDFDAAVADCVRLVGFTARRRKAKWKIIDPKVAAEEALGYVEQGRVAMVFGREDSGLPNEILDRVHAAVNVPTTNHASLNLAQAVLIALYELHLAAGDATRTLRGPRKEAPPPTADMFERYFKELHNALDAIQFFKTRFPEHIMRSFRAITYRANVDDRELSLLRAMSLEIVRFLERTDRIERMLPEDVSPRRPRHVTGRDTSRDAGRDPDRDLSRADAED
jgi:TrmH family RNA methyltransferase